MSESWWNRHLWLPLTLLCAFALATSDAFTKRATESHNEYLVMWLRLLYTVPVLLPLRLLAPPQELNEEFLRACLTALPLEALAVILYLKALKLSPLSLTLPFLGLTPVFLLVIPFLLLGERITVAGGCGILLIAAGTYLLNLRTLREEGILAPFKAIAREKGSRCMIGVAFIYSFTATLGKKGITASSPFYFISFYIPLLVLILAPVVLWKARKEVKTMLSSGILKSSLVPGICASVEMVSHAVAMSMAKVGYLIAVKRLSLLIGVIYGRILFKEGNIRERGVGAALILAGIFVIVTRG